MVLIIIIGQMIYAVWAGYTAANAGQLEHVTVAILFNIAVVVSFFASFFGEIYHFFIAQFLWVFVAFIVSEVVRIFDLVSNGE